jgi:hypothetical protein
MENAPMGLLGRLATGLFGALLVLIGLYALGFSEAAPAWRYLGGLAFVALGVNALYGAFTGRAPWILKIGPLP